MQTLSMATTSVRQDFSEICNALILCIFTYGARIYTFFISCTNKQHLFIIQFYQKKYVCFVGFPGIVLVKETRYAATMVCRSLKKKKPTTIPMNNNSSSTSNGKHSLLLFNTKVHSVVRPC